MPNALTTYTETIDGVAFKMIAIPKGTFEMGDEHGDLWNASRPIQTIKIKKPFYLGETPVTQALWQAVMGNNPSRIKSDKRPVEKVSWNGVQKFLYQLNEQTTDQFAKDGFRYRLPSESQWEYAARAGINHTKYKYAGSNNIKEVVWYGSNSHYESKPVGLKLPNEYGLFDMNGNVWEMCADIWKATLKGIPQEGSARSGGGKNLRVVRGGSWFNDDYDTRLAIRDGNYHDDHYFSNGFRLARY